MHIILIGPMRSIAMPFLAAPAETVNPAQHAMAMNMHPAAWKVVRLADNPVDIRIVRDYPKSTIRQTRSAAWRFYGGDREYNGRWIRLRGKNRSFDSAG